MTPDASEPPAPQGGQKCLCFLITSPFERCVPFQLNTVSATLSVDERQEITQNVQANCLSHGPQSSLTVSWSVLFNKGRGRESQNLKKVKSQMKTEQTSLFTQVLCCVCLVVSDSTTPETVAHQAPLSMGFSRQE